MIEGFNGIVLRTIKYSDTLMIADIYSREHGRVQFLVPISRSKRTKVRNILFQPLSILTFQASFRRGKALTRINDVQPHTLFGSIPYDAIKSSVALYLAEFLCNVLREEEGDDALFDFLVRSLRWLDSAEEGYANFHILFLVRLTCYLGIAPNVEEHKRGAFFDLQAGCIVGDRPLHRQYLTPEDTINFLELLKIDSYDTHIPLNRKARSEYLALLQNYYRLHITDFPPLNSYEVLKELFND